MLNLRQFIAQELRQCISEIMPQILPRLILTEHLKPCYSRYNTDYASNVGFLDRELDLVALSMILESRLNANLRNYYAAKVDSYTVAIDFITVRIHQQKWLNFDLHWELLGYWLWYWEPIPELSSNSINENAINQHEISWAMVYCDQRCHAVVKQLEMHHRATNADTLGAPIAIMAMQERITQQESHYQKLDYRELDHQNAQPSQHSQCSITNLMRQLSLNLIYTTDALTNLTSLKPLKEAEALAHSFLAIHDQVAILNLSITERWWYSLLAQRTREILRMLVPELPQIKF